MTEAENLLYVESTACSQSCGAMNQNRIPTYPQVSCYSLLLLKMLNLWHCPLTSPCCLSQLIYSCQLSVSDSSYSDGQPSQTKTAAGFSLVFGCLLRLTWFTQRCFDCQRLRLRGWCMCHKCTWLFRCCQCLQSFLDRTQFLKQNVHISLVVNKQLPDVAKFRYPGFTVARICPYSSSIGMSCDPRRRSSVFISENSFSTLAAYAAMSISGSRWSLKNSAINRLSRWVLFCSYTLTSLSEMSLALLYVNTETEIRLTQCTPDQRRRPGLIPLPGQQFFWSTSDAFSLYFILGLFRDPSIIYIISYCSKCMIICHFHLAQLVAPTSFSTLILGSDAIFSFVSSIQLHTMNWTQNTPLTITTFYFSSSNNSRWK